MIGIKCILNKNINKTLLFLLSFFTSWNKNFRTFLCPQKIYFSQILSTKLCLLELCCTLKSKQDWVNLTFEHAWLAAHTSSLQGPILHFISWSTFQLFSAAPLLHINAAKHSHLLPAIVVRWKLPSITRPLLAPKQPSNDNWGFIVLIQVRTKLHRMNFQIRGERVLEGDTNIIKMKNNVYKIGLLFVQIPILENKPQMA